MDPEKKSHHWRVIIISGLILLVGLASWLAFTTEIKSAFRPRMIEIKNNGGQGADKDEASLVGFWPFGAESSEPVNFLLLGAPGRGNDAPDLTDTILLARLDRVKNKIYLFSLPRDLLVKIPDSDNLTKFNALYAFNKNNQGHEFDALIKKTEDITGLKIDHYVFVDLKTVEQLVNIFGGVNVMVQKDILDNAFPGPNHSFQTFAISAGWRYLDGETALKYMRSRHSAAGDFDRAERQQEVLQALKQKVLALNFWDIGKFVEIYNALSANVKSDLNLLQIKGFWQDIKNIPGANVVKNELNSQNLIINGQMNLGGEKASILQPRAGVENYSEIQKYITETISK